jgi:hypothetical protein
MACRPVPWRGPKKILPLYRGKCLEQALIPDAGQQRYIERKNRLGVGTFIHHFGQRSISANPIRQSMLNDANADGASFDKTR